MGLPLVVEHLRWAFETRSDDFLSIDQLRLEPGQILALVGPSGAGKSTLLALLAGLDRPRLGHISWGEISLGDLRSSARDAWRQKHLGLVFQDFQLVDGLSALENVLLPLTFRHLKIPSGERKRAASLLESLGVPRITALAKSLSRGEQQRTALARALFGRPDVLLADEPTASLDASNEASVSQLLVDHARLAGATVVVSTHQSTLRDRADRVVELAHGRLKGEAQ